MYGKEFPTFDDICHHKYVKRERIGDKWRYFYDTKISGEAYKKQAREHSADAAYYKAISSYRAYMANKHLSGLKNASKSQDIVNAINRARYLNNEIKGGIVYQSQARMHDAKAAKANRDYYTKSLAGRISKAGMDIKKIINTIKNPPEVKKYKDVKTGISYKEKTYRDENGKVKEVRTTMSGAPITEKQKKAAKERKTKATAQQLANLARIDSIQQKYGDAMRKSYNGQNINDVRKKNTKKK